MNPNKLARIAVLCLLALVTVLTVPAEAAPRCGCEYCQQDPSRACNLDGQQTTCNYFLSVALCPAGATSSPADSQATIDSSFLALTSETAQEPSACVSLAN